MILPRQTFIYTVFSYIFLSKALYKISVIYYFYVTIQYLVRHFDVLLEYEWCLKDSISNYIIVLLYINVKYISSILQGKAYQNLFPSFHRG